MAASSYQTVPLSDYDPGYQQLAKQLFDRTAALVGRRISRAWRGSYSFQAEDGSTEAKIIIFQSTLGKQNGDAFPLRKNGVYVLIRAGASAPDTIGVAPKHDRRFTWEQVDSALLDSAANRIASRFVRVDARHSS